MLPLPLGIALLLTALLAGPAGGTPARSALQGGTLRVVLQSDFDFVDTALGSSPETQAVEHATCRTLYDPSSAKLVPDAAVSPPRVSRDGLSYTFTLRDGLKYDTGADITARDFAYAIQRVRDPKLSSPGTAYTADLASARAAGASKLVIRLKQPAPDLAFRLSTTFFCPLPPGTPHNPNGIQAPVPGSGPYYVASWLRNRYAVLKRNRFYRGSRAANPDEIVFTMGVSLENQRLLCESDAADVCGFPPNQAAALRAEYGVNKRRFFVKPRTTMWYLAVNANGALFGDNDQLARAVNYAVDRSAILRTSGALGGTRSDQLLPRGVPGFRNWNLYPLRAADRRKAKKLARGHLRDGKCQLWAHDGGSAPSIAQIVSRNLEQIGIHCDVTAMDQVDLLQKAGTRGAGYDLLLNVWTAPYRGPFAYMNVLLDGTQIHARNNLDLSYFDDAAWSRRLAAAATRSGRARARAYSSLDRDLMRGPAPIVPLFVSTSTGTLLSSRVGCFTFRPVYATDFGALCLDQQSSILSVSVTGAPGSVTSEPAGFSCAATCSSSFPYGSTVTLRATPAQGSMFVQWTAGCSGAVPRCTVTMNGARSVHAVFRKKRYPLTLAKTGLGAGSVTSSPAGIACGSQCSAAYDHGTVVTLTAHAATDSDFAGWSGACTGAAPTCAVTMTGATSVVGAFAKKTFTLTISKDPAGTGTGTVTSDPLGVDCGTTCAHAFDVNTAVTLTATPDTGSNFGGWSGACSGTGACNVTMDVAKAVTATFPLGSAPDVTQVFDELFAFGRFPPE
jgi:ABC-type transport system substrate-binding protein